MYAYTIPIIYIYLLYTHHLYIIYTIHNAQRFANSLPDLSLCSTLLPQQYIAHTNTTDVSHFVLTRPNSYDITHYDSLCTAVAPNTFYAIYTHNGNFGDPVNTYNISACTDSQLCPLYSSQVYCPCVSTTASDTCSTYQCSTHGSNDASCKSYEERLIGDCFCYRYMFTYAFMPL